MHHSVSSRCHAHTSVGLGSSASGSCYRASLLLLRQRCRRVAVAAANDRADRTPPSAAAKTLEDSGTRSFLSWATGAKITSTSLAPATFDGLRGMVATAPIEPEALLVSVPRASAIVLAPRQKCPFPDWIRREYWDAAPWFVKIALMLLDQQRQGSKARLAGYLQQLPESVDVPALWDERALQSLQYAHLINLVKEQQKEWNRLHETLTSSGLQPGSAPIPKDNFFWAMSCVRSRTFSGPYVGSTLQDRVRLALFVVALALTNATLGISDPETTASAALAVLIFNLVYELLLSRSAKQYAMCPLIDFINHSSTVESEVSYEYVSDSFTVVASRSYQKGDQVYVNYGQTNDGLMQFYGFSEPNNAKDSYVMSNLLKWVDQMAPADQSRLDKLNKAGLLNTLQLVSVARNGFPGETLQALRFLLSPASSSDPSPSDFASPGAPELEAKLAAMLVYACKQEVASLGTTMEEDQALLANAAKGRGVGGALSDRDRTAIAFRLEKKKVLAACLKSLGVDVAGGAGAGEGEAGPGAKKKSASKGFA